MIVKGDRVVLTKEELEDVIVKCSGECAAKLRIDDALLIMIHGLITVGVVKEVNKKIFGEEK